MARIAGVDIPRDKRVVIALTYIFGVGPTKAQQITAATAKLANPTTIFSGLLVVPAVETPGNGRSFCVLRFFR